jgi:TRAP-type C4-dicarboxylate transport system substrate-binding protein
MKQERIGKVLYLLLAFVLILGFQVGHAAGQVKKVEWKVQCVYPTTAVTSINIENIARLIEKRTGGNFQIKVFAPGQLVKERELFTAVSKGMVEGGVSNLNYYSKIIPVAEAKYGPFLAMNNQELAYLMLETDYPKPVRKECAGQNIFFVGSTPTHPAVLISRKNVRTLAEMRGFKVRGAGIYNEIARAWSAIPISIDPAEMYTALQQGTMDGVFYPIVASVRYKLHEQIKYVIQPGPFETCADFFVNHDSYNALPGEWQKMLIDTFMKVAVTDAVEVGKEEFKEKEAFLKKVGIEFINWADADVRKAKELCEPIREKFRAASPASAEVIAIAEKALEEYRRKYSTK